MNTGSYVFAQMVKFLDEFVDSVAQKMRIKNIFKLGGKVYDYPEVLRRFEYYDDEQTRPCLCVPYKCAKP